MDRSYLGEFEELVLFYSGGNPAGKRNIVATDSSEFKTFFSMKKGWQPPNRIDQILKWQLSPEQYENVPGDMHALFRQWINERGERQARWRYILHSFTFLTSSQKIFLSTVYSSNLIPSS